MVLTNTWNMKENLLKILKEWIQYIPIKWRNNLSSIKFARYANITVKEAEEFFCEMYNDGYLSLKLQIRCPTCKDICSIDEHEGEIFECNNCVQVFKWGDYIESADYIYSANKDLLTGVLDKEKKKSPIDLLKEKMKKNTDKIIELDEFNKENEENEGVKVFISYAHEDEEYMNKLIKHLAVLKRNNVIKEWHDREIMPGQALDDEINKNLLESEIILLMISSDFLSSDYCYNIEMTKALEMNESHSAKVIPIIVRKCDWMDSPFSALMALPTDGKAIKSWSDGDEAYLNIVEGIKKVVKSIKGETI